MRISIKRLMSIVLPLVCLVLSNPSFALTKGFEAISLRPATDGGPYVGIWGSKNLKQLGWELGTLGVYAYRPLELARNGNRVRGVLDKTAVQHFYGQLGLVDRWLSIGFDVPMGWWLDFRDPSVSTSTNQNKMAVGDVYVNLKSELVRSKYFGLAIRPFVSIPTGYGKEFFGNGYVTGGGTLIAEITPVKPLSFSLNAGVQARKKFTFMNIEKSNQLELGFGTALQIAKPISIVAEVATSTRLSGPFKEEVNSPIEARGAIKWKIGKSGLLATAGGSGGILKGAGVPTYSVFAGISFSPRRRVSTKRKKIDFSEYTLHFDENSYDINSSEDANKLCDFSDQIRDENIDIAVKGYAYSQDSEEANISLSEKRAEKVNWFLNLLGIGPSHISVLALGSADPIADTSTDEGRAKNARVEFDESN